jgi:hypothetical protein
MNAGAAGLADDFAADCRRSFAVWTRQPLLPLISVLFWTLPAASYGNDALHFVLAVVTIIFLGWPGTEREWYRRAFAGEPFRLSEIWPTTQRFFGPFLRLGLLVLPLVIPLIAYVISSESAPAAGLGVSLVLFFVLDVVLTFVTPALTFTTSSARSALSIGVAMLRRQWPAAAPYALTPALVVILGAQTLLEPIIGPAGALVGTALACLVELALKGATVAFYLRHVPAPSR